MTPLERVALPADALTGESVVALYFSDQKPVEGPAALLDWRLDGQLTKMLIDGQVQGRAGEHVMLQNNGKLKADWILFVGGGKWHGLCQETHASLIRHMLSVARQAGFKDVALSFMPHQEVAPDVLQQQIEDALILEGSGIDACRFSCETDVSV
jgi:hypothetical protein